MQMRCLQLSVRGALERWGKDPLPFKHKDGKLASAEEGKSYLLEHLSEGHEFLPLEDCPNWEQNGDLR
jgi:hypothetical protein